MLCCQKNTLIPFVPLILAHECGKNKNKKNQGRELEKHVLPLD